MKRIRDIEVMRDTFDPDALHVVIRRSNGDRLPLKVHLTLGRFRDLDRMPFSPEQTAKVILFLS